MIYKKDTNQADGVLFYYLRHNFQLASIRVGNEMNTHSLQKVSLSK